MKYIIVTTATDNAEEAIKLANGLIENKFAASVHINKVESFYTWKKITKNNTEYSLIIKSTKKNYKNIEDYIYKNHHYDLPEIISMPIKKGLKSFFGWIDENTLK